MTLNIDKCDRNRKPIIFFCFLTANINWLVSKELEPFNNTINGIAPEVNPVGKKIYRPILYQKKLEPLGKRTPSQELLEVKT